MNRSVLTLCVAAVIALSLSAHSVHATETENSSQTPTEINIGHGTEATDRGGSPGSGDSDSGDSVGLIDWLTGLMD